MRVKELTAFIKKRENHRLVKEGLVTSYNATFLDPIIAKYRFCNVRREDDRVTRWIAGNIREPAASTTDLWFLIVWARLFNKPETLEVMDGFTLSGEHVRNLHIDLEIMRTSLKKRRDRGPIFNAAYIVSTNGKSMDKVDYIIDLVLKPLWKDRASIRPHKGDTLESWHQKLMMYDGLGSFMAAQIVADMKYAEPLKHASDWWTFAASGPGSRRGLNRIMNRPAGFPRPEASWRDVVWELRESVNMRLPEPLHAQDLQNCLCEFDKYERARLGEGKPKQLYKPHGEK